MAKVEVLKNFGRDVAARKKWLQIWEQLGVRILRMPEYMQDIVLEDINTAVRNRIALMEIIQKCRGKS